ncbi:MAG: FMN-binding protein [Desulfobacterales bacterium]|nr:FMN-binding protein [Desulfobacterales bacterium]
MSDTLKSIWFAAITALISSLLLTGASSGLKDYRLANIKIDNQKNLLKSVGLLDARARYSGEEIEGIYQANIHSYRADASGVIVPEGTMDEKRRPLFLYVKDNTIQAYILPVHSRGLWGKIEGYLALEKDGQTVAGFTVFNHGETPGLGGEIETAWFQNNFRGKKITDPNGRFVSIGIAKGKVADRLPPDSQANFVDGISGATLTGRLLSQGLLDTLQAYEKVSTHFRQGQIDLNR